MSFKPINLSAYLCVLILFNCSPEKASNENVKEIPPNIVIIMADDLGYGDIACFGNETYKTPHLDKMAENGLKFTDFHSNGAVCTPTRAALLTGRYQQRAGMEGVIYVRGETREVGIAKKEITFADLLKENGYATGIFGKWHLGYKKEYNPVHQGFDQFVGYVSGNVDFHSHYDNAGIFDWWHDTTMVEEKGYVTDLITDHAIDFIKANKDQPFCTYIAHEAPHWPYQGRNDPADRFPDVKFNSKGSSTDYPGAYKEMVEVMDENIGRVFQTLEELGLSENTLVFFCSDNGGVPDLGNNGNLRGAKTTLWEGGHRVPAIAYWAGKISPSETQNTVLSMDVMPTILALTETSVPENLTFDGVDISKVLLENKPLDERPVFWRYRKQKAVRKREWKLLIEKDSVYLFNLADDLQEQNNLTSENPELVKELEGLLENWEKDVDVKQLTL